METQEGKPALLKTQPSSAQRADTLVNPENSGAASLPKLNSTVKEEYKTDPEDNDASGTKVEILQNEIFQLSGQHSELGSLDPINGSELDKKAKSEDKSIKKVPSEPKYHRETNAGPGLDELLGSSSLVNKSAYKTEPKNSPKDSVGTPLISENVQKVLKQPAPEFSISEDTPGEFSHSFVTSGASVLANDLSFNNETTKAINHSKNNTSQEIKAGMGRNSDGKSNSSDPKAAEWNMNQSSSDHLTPTKSEQGLTPLASLTKKIVMQNFAKKELSNYSPLSGKTMLASEKPATQNISVSLNSSAGKSSSESVLLAKEEPSGQPPRVQSAAAAVQGSAAAEAPQKGVEPAPGVMQQTENQFQPEIVVDQPAKQELNKAIVVVDQDANIEPRNSEVIRHTQAHSSIVAETDQPILSVAPQNQIVFSSEAAESRSLIQNEVIAARGAQEQRSQLVESGQTEGGSQDQNGAIGSKLEANGTQDNTEVILAQSQQGQTGEVAAIGQGSQVGAEPVDGSQDENSSEVEMSDHIEEVDRKVIRNKHMSRFIHDHRLKMAYKSHRSSNHSGKSSQQGVSRGSTSQKKDSQQQAKLAARRAAARQSRLSQIHDFPPQKSLPLTTIPRQAVHTRRIPRGVIPNLGRGWVIPTEPVEVCDDNADLFEDPPQISDTRKEIIFMELEYNHRKKDLLREYNLAMEYIKQESLAKEAIVLQLQSQIEEARVRKAREAEEEELRETEARRMEKMERRQRRRASRSAKKESPRPRVREEVRTGGRESESSGEKEVVYRGQKENRRTTGTRRQRSRDEEFLAKNRELEERINSKLAAGEGGLTSRYLLQKGSGAL